jgi:pimeloyl-ACP methyl ester carboxylesterase
VSDLFRLRSIDVEGGTLTVGLSGPDPSRARATVVAAHGITASLVSWNAVARALPDDIALAAVDLRGRGASAPLPPPFGMRAHSEDLLRVIDALSLDAVVAAGHSMGGYVTSMLAATHPTRVRSLVLIDGGFPLPAPVGLPPEQIVEAVVGPAVSRLSMTFASREEYHDFWRRHPAFLRGAAWNDDVVAYVDYDLQQTDLERTDLEGADREGTNGALRSRVSAAAVQADGLELIVDPVAGRAVERVRCPIEIVRVERGLLDEPSPLVPLAIIDDLVRGPHTVTTVADLNHYTVMFDPRGAAAIAAAMARAASASRP